MEFDNILLLHKLLVKKYELTLFITEYLKKTDLFDSDYLSL